jgi:hypothetical protein
VLPFLQENQTPRPPLFDNDFFRELGQCSFPQIVNRQELRKADFRAIDSVCLTSYFYSGFEGNTAKPLNRVISELSHWSQHDLSQGVFYRRDKKESPPRIVLLPSEYEHCLPKKFETLFLFCFADSPEKSAWKKSLIGITGLGVLSALFSLARDEKERWTFASESRVRIFRIFVDKLIRSNGGTGWMHDIKSDHNGKEAFQLMLCTACATELVSPDEIIDAMEDILRRNPSSFIEGDLPHPDSPYLTNVQFQTYQNENRVGGLPKLISAGISTLIHRTWNSRKADPYGRVSGRNSSRSNSQLALQKIVALESVLHASFYPMRWTEFLAHEDRDMGWGK